MRQEDALSLSVGGCDHNGLSNKWLVPIFLPLRNPSLNTIGRYNGHAGKDGRVCVAVVGAHSERRVLPDILDVRCQNEGRRDEETRSESWKTKRGAFLPRDGLDAGFRVMVVGGNFEVLLRMFRSNGNVSSILLITSSDLDTLIMKFVDLLGKD